MGQHPRVEIIDVAAAVIERNGKVLVARRSAGQHLAFKWEFPGGKIEEGESPEQCLQRELVEEMGIRIKVGDFIGENLHYYEDKSIHLLAYHAEYIAGEFCLSVHDGLRWLVPSELMSIDLAEADIPIARLAHAKLSSCGK